MKILMIAPQPFLQPRGTPISVYQRLNGLSTLGHDVDLVTYHIGRDVDIPQVAIYRSPRVPFINKVRIGPSFAKIPLDIVLFFKALWMIMTRRYDAIHSHEEAAFFAMLLGAIFRVPHVYDMHSSMPKQLQNFNFGNAKVFIKLFDWLEKLVLRTCDVVLTIGSDLEDYVLQCHPTANHIRIENVAVQSNLMADHESPAAMRERLGLNGRLAIVYTGTFERYQGLDLLFDSIKLVHAQRPEAVFVMVGGRPDQVAHWQAYVNEAGLSESVIFVGTVPLEESLTYLEAADMLISPRTEGLSVPLKLYSYMRSGKPIVATNIFAHTQILTGETAVLTELTPDSYAAGILQLVESADLRAEIGGRAKAFADDVYSQKNYLTKLSKAYLSVQHAILINDVPQSLLEVPGEKTLSRTAIESGQAI